MATQVTYKVSTRKDKDQDKSQAKSTALTINFDGMSTEDYQVIGAKHIVIARQNYWRKHGVPATDKVSALAFVHGARQSLTPEVAQAVVLEAAAQDPIARARLIAQLQAMAGV